MLLPFTSLSGVAKGGGHAGACAPGRRPWGRISTLFQPFKNALLSTSLDQNMHKNAYFLEKSCKIAAASNGFPTAGDFAPRPPRDYSHLLI